MSAKVAEIDRRETARKADEAAGAASREPSPKSPAEFRGATAKAAVPSGPAVGATTPRVSWLEPPAGPAPQCQPCGAGQPPSGGADPVPGFDDPNKCCHPLCSDEGIMHCSFCAPVRSGKTCDMPAQHVAGTPCLWIREAVLVPIFVHAMGV